MHKLTSIKGNVLYLNFLGVLLAVALYVVFYKFVWQVKVPIIALNHKWLEIPLLAVALVAFVYLHESIHAFVAMVFIKSKHVSIHWRWLVCECRVHTYLTRNQFIIYGLAPAVVMGVASVAIYYLFPSIAVKYFAAVAFVASVASGAGDFWFIAKIIHYPDSVCVLDHGSEMDIFSAESIEQSA
jgi:hypothetical protein